MYHKVNDETNSSMTNGHQSETETASPAKSPRSGSIKKRGRPPKGKADVNIDAIPMKQTKVTDTMKKTKRNVNRFNGITKEELMQRHLPDRIKHGLDILIIGINPGLFAVYKGHHYAGPGNHFWDCVNMSGLVDKPASCENDLELLDYGIGFSTIVKRTTASAKDLTSQEIRDGGKELVEKIQTYHPKIAVFNGKGIYEVFSKEMFGQKKKDFVFGRQTYNIPGTDTDKVHYFIEIKQLRDEVNGVGVRPDVEETNYTFDLRNAKESARVKMEFPTMNEHHSFLPSPHSRGQTSANIQDDRGSGGRKSSASTHPNLVRFLKQTEEQPSTVTSPTTSFSLRTPLRHMDAVSEELRNERVGSWVRTQLDQNYESEPPMGYEDRLRSGEVPLDQPESDHGSQQSMVSAGVSGSTSAGSTSGYGSVDSHPHRARQDRVEMWVREQQYVQEIDPRRSNNIRASEVELELYHQNERLNTARHSSHPAGPSSAINEDLLRPPVPLYSSWGESRSELVAGTAHDSSSNHSALATQDHSQITISSLIP